MRLRLLFLLPLLASCAKEYGPVRLDLVAASGLVSSSTSAGVGDTVVTRFYADSRSDSQGSGEPITNLRIQVIYEPTPTPISYPSVLATFNRDTLPNTTVVYFDGKPADLLNSTGQPAASDQEFAFQYTASTRTTSGTERWEFQARTASGSASRAYRLVVRNADSLRVYHAYTLRPRLSAKAGSLAYVALRPGLLLPGFAVSAAQPANQALIDLVCVQRSNSLLLEAPRATTLNTTLTDWPADNRRRTVFARTALTEATFTAAVTAGTFRQAFFAGTATADSLSSGALEANNVLAFRTADRRYGLVRVVSVTKAGIPRLVLAVRVQK